MLLSAALRSPPLVFPPLSLPTMSLMLMPLRPRSEPFDGGDGRALPVDVGGGADVAGAAC